MAEEILADLRPGPELSPAWRAELDNRLEEIRAGKADWLDGERALFEARERTKRLERFPFSIIYLYEAEQIDIVAVWHHKRDPLDLQERVKTD